MNQAAVIVAPDPTPDPGEWRPILTAAALVPGGWLAVVCNPDACPHVAWSLHRAGLVLGRPLAWVFGSGVPPADRVGLRPAWVAVVIAHTPGIPRPPERFVQVTGHRPDPADVCRWAAEVLAHDGPTVELVSCSDWTPGRCQYSALPLTRPTPRFVTPASVASPTGRASARGWRPARGLRP